METRRIGGNDGRPLKVGITDTKLIGVILDRPSREFLLSAEQARDLARLLYQKARELEGLNIIEATSGHPLLDVCRGGGSGRLTLTASDL
jgi:hypothetical protein